MPIATVNPASEDVLEEFAPHDDAEIERRLARADAAVGALARTTFAERALWMNAAADLLEADVDELARTITIEMGKPIAQARAEVLKCATGMRFYAANAEGFLAEELLDAPGQVGASRAWTRYQPLGVVLAVMPWNYPLWQVARFAGPALMAGNVGVLKHASNVPLAALYLDTLWERAGFPAGSFQSLLVGAAAVEGIIADPRVKAITLTGSEPAGRSVAAAAGAHIKKTVLELGGSDPFLVLPSADVATAAEVAVTARVNNNGQSCIAGKRFIVHADVFDAFTTEFTRRMAALVVGDPLEEGTDVGPLATRSGRDELAELVDDAVAKGATVLTGGRAPDGPGFFYPPTVITGVTEEMRLYQEEAFGPVAVVYRAANVEEAVQIANATRFGLSSAAWTNDAEEERYLIDALDAGAVFINGMTISYPELPFGGIKDSGYGRELAAAGIREFCNLKTVWKA
jgi:succinate-semialdehyde dehydrogenase / glutarate-semialdehyde dehydrogenase